MYSIDVLLVALILDNDEALRRRLRMKHALHESRHGHFARRLNVDAPLYVLDACLSHALSESAEVSVQHSMRVYHKSPQCMPEA